VPISNNVVAAFLLFGFLNAGTPLAMASTPVSAVHPWEKARMAKKTRANADMLTKELSGSIV